MPNLENLRTKFAGLDFKNPLVMPSGNLGLSLPSLERGVRSGVAAVTIKSAWVGPPHPYVRIHARPTMTFLPNSFRMYRTMVNWGGVFIALEDELEMISRLKPMAQDHNCLIIGSLTADEAKLDCQTEFRQAVKEIDKAGADLLEIVVSCPYTRGSTSEELGVDKKLVSTLFKIAKEATDIPVIAKIAYEYHAYLLEMLGALRDVGIKYIHIFTRYRGTLIDVETGEPIVPGPSTLHYGHLRRPASNRATAFVRDFDKNFEIIGSGGVWNTNDCIERLMCGANLVAIHTAINYHGQKLFTELNEGISQFLEKKQWSLDDIVGIAVPQIVDPQAFWRFKQKFDVPRNSLTLEVDLEKCTRCGLCTNCIFGAWSIKDSEPVINLDVCERCGICISICPVQAIRMEKV
jgi:dihydroorotate dehydrogenase/Pyruvate/2-oxoacid:ferredoxin oxidoreductase delta subunit